MNLDMVVLYVRNMDAAKKFYMEVIGMSVVEQISSPTFVTLRSESGAMVALQDKAAARFAPKDEDRPETVELSFRTKNADIIWQHWQEQGITLLSEPTDIAMVRYFLAQDPEGHYLSVYSFNQHE